MSANIVLINTVSSVGVCHSHLELSSDERKREAKDEESSKTDGNGDLASGARGERQGGLVGVFDVQISSQQRSLLLTESSACGANGLAGEHGHFGECVDWVMVW